MARGVETGLLAQLQERGAGRRQMALERPDVQAEVF
jgi:hypothetical protein